MKKEWAPSFWGQKLTGSPDWRLCLDGLELSLKMNGRIHQVNIEKETAYRINSGLLWTDITFFPGQGQETKADGLPNVSGTALTQALDAALTENLLRKETEFVQAAHQKINHWIQHKTDQEKTAIQARRWFTHEMQQAVVAARPSIDVNAIRARLKLPSVVAKLGSQAKDVELSLLTFETNPQPTWDALNAAHSQRELKDCKTLFDHVESKPLTEEQALAVICFDNRVQVVASAGSG